MSISVAKKKAGVKEILSTGAYALLTLVSTWAYILLIYAFAVCIGGGP